MITIKLFNNNPIELQQEDFSYSQKRALLEALQKAFENDTGVFVETYQDKEKTKLLTKHRAWVISGGVMNALTDFRFTLV